MRTPQQIADIVTLQTKNLYLELGKKWGFPTRVIANASLDLAVSAMLQNGYTIEEILILVRRLAPAVVPSSPHKT